MTSPGADNSISNLIQQWDQAKAAQASLVAWYKQEIQDLLAMAKSGHAAEALWLFQTEAMPAATQSCEYDMELQSDAMQIANNLRNDITNAQNYYNQFLAGLNGGNSTLAKQAAQELQSALKYLCQALHITGMTNLFPPGSSGQPGQLTNLENFIKTIRTNAEGANGTNMYTYMHNLYSQATKAGTPMPPQLNSITSAFNQLNQSVSGISSSIQTKMQQLNQNLQQYFGIYKSFFDDYSQLSSFIISHSK